MCLYIGWDSLLRSGIVCKRGVPEGGQRDGKPKRMIGSVGRVVHNFPAIAPYPVTSMETWWCIAKRWRLWGAGTQLSYSKPSSVPQWWSAGALSPRSRKSTRSVTWLSQKTVSMIFLSDEGMRISLLEEMGVSKSWVHFVFEFRLIIPSLIPSNYGVQKMLSPMGGNMLTHWGRGHLNCLNVRYRGF